MTAQLAVQVLDDLMRPVAGAKVVADMPTDIFVSPTGGDDTSTIQGAIDAAQAAGSFFPRVMFNPGEYHASSTLLWRSAPLEGVWPKIGTRIVWTGPSGGGPMFLKDNNSPGGASFCAMRRLNLDGAAKCVTLIDFSQVDIDEMCQLEEMDLEVCLGDAILSKAWTNAHFRKLRFDAVGGYALHFVVAPTQNLATIALDDFTYDNGVGNGGSLGVVNVDNTVNQSNVGTLKLSNGRIELNSPLGGAGGGKAIVDMVYSAGAVNWLGVCLDSITVDNTSTGEPNLALLNLRGAGGTQFTRTSFVLGNVRGGPYATVLRGPNGNNWNGLAVAPSDLFGLVQSSAA